MKIKGPTAVLHNSTRGMPLVQSKCLVRTHCSTSCGPSACKAAYTDGDQSRDEDPPPNKPPLLLLLSHTLNKSSWRVAHLCVVTHGEPGRPIQILRRQRQRLCDVCFSSNRS